MLSLLLLGVLFAAGAEVERRRVGARVSVGYYAAGAADAPVAYRKQPARLVSPLPGVSWFRWATFVKSMRVALFGAVGPGDALGAFQMRPPALFAVGLLEEAKRVGRDWAVRWKTGRDRDVFLADKGLQYRAFMALNVANLEHVKKRLPGLVGRETPYGVASLSGVLAVLAVAGRKGGAAWFKRPEEGVRFPHTVAAFKRGNGVF